MNTQRITNIAILSTLMFILITMVFVFVPDSLRDKERTEELDKLLFDTEPIYNLDTINMYAESSIEPYWYKKFEESANIYNGIINRDTLEQRVQINYFTNSPDIPVPVEYIKKSIIIQYEAFTRAGGENGIKIKPKFLPVRVILNNPIKNKEILPSGSSSEALSTYSYSTNYWAYKYENPEALNINIFNSKNIQEAATSMGVPATIIKLNLYKAIDPVLMTIGHELGHSLGLSHTHEYDVSKFGFSYETGDFINDLPKTPPLTNLVSKDCELKEDFEEVRRHLESLEMYKTNSPIYLRYLGKYKKLVLNNIMSYTYKPCRDTLTEEQNALIKFTLKTNRDLRNTFTNFNRDNYLKQVYSEIQQ